MRAISASANWVFTFADSFIKLRIYKPMLAGVVKLVDALDSKSSDLRIMRVRFPPPAHTTKKPITIDGL
jgi:hypothetical protein